MKYDLVGKEKFLIKTALLSWFADVVSDNEMNEHYPEEVMMPVVQEVFESQEAEVLSKLYESDIKLMLSDMFDLINKLK